MSAHNLPGLLNENSAVFVGYELDPTDPTSNSINMLNVQFSNKVSLLDSGDLASAPGLAPGSQAAPVGETEGTDFGNPVQSQNATMSSL